MSSKKTDKSFVQVGSSDFEFETKKALASYSGHLLGGSKHESSFGSSGRDVYRNFDTNTSLREQFTKEDYDRFRPDEAVAKNPTDIIAQCRNAYRKVGVVRNIMDLMADFGSQGAKIVHPNPSIQKFYRAWWKKVEGNRICERFLNLFYREGVAVTKRTMGKIPTSEVKKMKSLGEKLRPDIEYQKGLDTQKRNIPLKYNFLNPLSLKVVEPELSRFIGEDVYALKISKNLRNVVQNPQSDIQKKLVNKMSKEIRKSIARGDNTILLDPDKVSSYFYKKDDWQTWADPMTYAIMDDIKLLEKMKLADLAALDGAISQVRLWKLGDMEKGIFPTANAINRLSEILTSNPGGGAFDIIWGPELSVEEYKTSVHQFLGKEKYEPIWSSIYEGLGVPPTLTGASSSKGSTNNYISLKTLIQRLEYGREALKSFWSKELKLVQEAMKFKQPAEIVFDNMVLADEAAEKALLIQLVDRDIISIEALQEKFGEIPEIENLRMKKEERDRKNGKIKSKAGPWHTPEKIFQLMKIALQKGFISPEQTGMTEEFPEEFLDIEAPFDKQEKLKTGQTEQDENGGEPQQGRPKNSKDTEKRDERTPKPISGNSSIDNTAAYLTATIWAKGAYEEISEIINPIILQYHDKKSLTALSSEQVKQAEMVKFSVLCQTDIFSDISRGGVKTALASGKPPSKKCIKIYEALKASTIAKTGQLSLDDQRALQISAYSIMNYDLF